MKLDGLMTALAQRDLKLSACDGQLTISGAKGALTAELKQQLQRHKDGILALLDAQRVGESPSEIQPDPARRHEPFPFSDLQTAFYMADDPYMEFHVRPHYYCEQDWATIDVERYERALNKALQRHRGEIVLITGDRQLSVLHDVPYVKCKINDLRQLSTEEATAELLRIRERFSREELPLDRWPWFDLQVSLWREENCERARLHSNQNNFYTDGFGATVLQNEIDRYYEDPTLELPPLSLSFRDAVLGLQALAESEAGRRAQKYWLDRLPELPEPPPLPQTNAERRARSRLRRRDNALSAYNWSELKKNAALCGLTPTSAIVTAYAEILCAWSGSQHFILSNMTTRRLPLHQEVREIVGNFASLYPLEIDLRGDGTFADKALRLQQQILRDSNHLEWGGMQVMQAFNRLKGELGSVPCPFVVGSGLFMGAVRKADFSCLETSQTMLDHQFWELDDGRYYYVWDLLEEYFPDGVIDSMWRAFDELLRRLATDPDAWRATRFELAPPMSTQVAFVQGEVPPGLLHQGLAQTLARTPDKAVLETAEASFSYAELNAHSNAVAQALSAQSPRPGELVALVMDRGPALLAATLGILKAGAAYVPVDASLPSERRHYMLQNSRARVVLTQQHYRETLDWPGDLEVICIDALEPSTVALPQAAVADTDLAYVIYTSGSTGNPKGVMIDHRGALNTVVDINRRFGIGPDDKVFGASSFSFDLSVYDVFGVLHAGATLVYPEPGAALNPAHWLELLERKSVTVWNSAPPLMSLLAETAARQGSVLPALRLVMLSGDWIPVDLPGLIRKIAPNARIVSLGGATEASIWSIFFPIDRVDPSWSSIPYGKPLTNQGWRILDAQGRPAPVWTPGELYITGIGLAQGYWRDEEKTARSFLIDPLSGQRRYRTGDRGRYLPDGNIEFLGRLDSQVKIQGHRIELGEIEAALHECPHIKEAVVLAPTMGAATSGKPSRARQLVAYITEQGNGNGGAATIEAAQAFLQQKLPVYMVPKGWAVLERMPLNANGKIDRKALAKVPHSSESGRSGRAAPVGPRTELETQLAAIWCKVLARDAVGVNEDFFDIGGQSFDAVRCVALIHEQLKRTLSLGDMWQARTIECLAQHLAQADADAEKCLVPIHTKIDGRPYFWVHPGGGQVTGYYELARRLARPSYGFVATAKDVDSGALESIERAAERYLTLLREVQPKGPYTLGGWSSGGCIAFEMAYQLERAGETVDRLVVIDAPAPLEHTPIDDVQMLRGFFEDLDLALPVRAITAETLGDAVGEAQFLRAIAQFPQRPGILSQPTPLYAFYRVFKRIVDSVRAYRPRSIAAQIVLARADAGVVTEFASHPHADRTDWGWARLTRGSVYGERLRGSHYTLLKRPNVDAVARVVNGIKIAEWQAASHITEISRP